MGSRKATRTGKKGKRFIETPGKYKKIDPTEGMKESNGKRGDNSKYNPNNPNNNPNNNSKKPKRNNSNNNSNNNQNNQNNQNNIEKISAKFEKKKEEEENRQIRQVFEPQPQRNNGNDEHRSKYRNTNREIKEERARKRAIQEGEANENTSEINVVRRKKMEGKKSDRLKNSPVNAIKSNIANASSESEKQELINELKTYMREKDYGNKSRKIIEKSKKKLNKMINEIKSLIIQRNETKSKKIRDQIKKQIKEKLKKIKEIIDNSTTIKNLEELRNEIITQTRTILRQAERGLSTNNNAQLRAQVNKNIEEMQAEFNTVMEFITQTKLSLRKKQKTNSKANEISEQVATQEVEELPKTKITNNSAQKVEELPKTNIKKITNNSAQKAKEAFERQMANYRRRQEEAYARSKEEPQKENNQQQKDAPKKKGIITFSNIINTNKRNKEYREKIRAIFLDTHGWNPSNDELNEAVKNSLITVESASRKKVRS